MNEGETLTANEYETADDYDRLLKTKGRECWHVVFASSMITVDTILLTSYLCCSKVGNRMVWIMHYIAQILYPVIFTYSFTWRHIWLGKILIIMKRIKNDKDVFKGLAGYLYGMEIQKLVSRLRKCLENSSDYVDRQVYTLSLIHI